MIQDKTVQERIKKNPLEELIEDESQASTWGEELLKNMLKPYAYIGQDTKEVRFRDNASNLPAKIRILLLFMAKLAQKRLGLITDESVSQKEAINLFTLHGIPEGTVKISLKQLRDNMVITKISEGRYSIGFDKLERLQQEFNKYGRKEN